ncbi:unnamed protein product [Schistocephalus solidus]|uniref:Uncharacterized protein n=1 Tax=Schistocephalus solidus TaxID=70667 RepID=A0A183TE90_SCHSO|nr:unnamed protein product [Schistocephalus solidus]
MCFNEIKSHPDANTLINTDILPLPINRLINTSIPTPQITTTTITSATTDLASPDLPCPHCHRTLTSCIGLVSNLRILRMDTGKPVPGAQNTVTVPSSHVQIAQAL